MGFGDIKTTYTLPDQSLPSLKLEDHLADVRELSNWIEATGIETANTRIARYIKYLEKCCDSNTWPASTPIFNDPSEHPFKHPIDRHLYVLREVHELTWIVGGFKMHKPKGLEPKLRSIVKGSDFAALDRDSSSRNTQFELRIASHFCRNGYEVDLSSDTDVLASSPKETFYVECKRVASRNLLDRRLKEAEKQLNSRLPRNTHRRRHYGIAAVDVTKVAFEQNGLTWALSADHSKDIVQDRLISISSGIVAIDPAKVAKNILLTWLQIHIPALIVYPPQCITRFSNYFLMHRLGGTRLRAFNRLRPVLEAGQIRDEREIGPEKLKLRNGITLPAGTVMEWDEPLLDYFVDSLLLPSQEPAHLILTLTIGSTKHEFFFHDLEAVVCSLDEEVKSRLRGDKPRTMGLFAALLLGFRYPYEDKYAFDSSFQAHTNTDPTLVG